MNNNYKAPRIKPHTKEIQNNFFRKSLLKTA